MPIEEATPEDLANANMVHQAIELALEGLPSLHRAVVADEFNLDIPVPKKTARAAGRLPEDERKAVLSEAMDALRKVPSLKRVYDAWFGA